MIVLIGTLGITLSLLLGCSDQSEPHKTALEAVSGETERLYQEREALIYGIEKLDREADAQRALRGGE